MILTSDVWLEAAKNGQLEKLQQLRRQRCPRHKAASYYASMEGHWEVVKWLHITGKALANAHTFVHAAQMNNIEMVKWLYNKRCVWSSQALTVAIADGHTQLVHWMLEHNFPSDENTVNAAVNKGDCKLVDLLIKHGAPKSVDAYTIAATNNDFTMIEYLDWLNFPLTSATLNACYTEEISKWVQHRLNEEDLIFYMELPCMFELF